MAIDFEYTCGENEFRFRPSALDWETMARLHKHLPREIDLIRIDGIDERESVRRLQLIAAVEQTVSFMTQDRSVIPLTYEFLIDQNALPRGMSAVWDSGSLSGIALPGVDGIFHELETGLDKCTLTSVQYFKDAPDRRVSKDIREQSSIETTNIGTIKLRAVRSKALVATLRKLDKFLSTCVAEEVVKLAW